MANEEKELELSVEEMKNAVAMSNFLPELLNIISEMNNRMTRLDDNLAKQATALNTYTKSVGDYIGQINTLIAKIENNEKNKKDFAELNNKLNELKTLISKIPQVSTVSSEAPSTKKPKGGKEIPVSVMNKIKEEKNYTVDDLEFYTTCSKLFADTRSKKTFLLTSIYVKTTYKCSEKTANRIVDLFKKHSCLNNNMGKMLPQNVMSELMYDANLCNIARKNGKLIR